MTKIQWAKNADGSAGKTWNVIVGCRRVSAGCENCYAEGTVHRGMSPQHKGLTVMGKNGVRWNGEYNLAEHRLDEPLRRKKPTTYFVNSLSDLFFEPLPFELIAAIFGVMAASPQHTFQVLTKRPARALEFFEWVQAFRSIPGAASLAWEPRLVVTSAARDRVRQVTPTGGLWPLPNVHLGVSVEGQATADERIPLLLQLPAAVRWVSYEPALGPVDFQRIVRGFREGTRTLTIDTLRPSFGPGLDWVVVGGESGHGARPFDLAWARSTVEQCRAAGVPVFVKQLGAMPEVGASEAAAHRRKGQPGRWFLDLKSRKGDDMDEWPEDLRVREMPT